MTNERPKAGAIQCTMPVLLSQMSCSCEGRIESAGTWHMGAERKCQFGLSTHFKLKGNQGTMSNLDIE